MVHDNAYTKERDHYRMFESLQEMPMGVVSDRRKNKSVIYVLVSMRFNFHHVAMPLLGRIFIDKIALVKLKIRHHLLAFSRVSFSRVFQSEGDEKFSSISEICRV